MIGHQVEAGMRAEMPALAAAVDQLRRTLDREITVGRRWLFVHSRRAGIARLRRRVFGRQWPGR